MELDTLGLAFNSITGTLDVINELKGLSSPECGATLWCRYSMPHVAFSVAVVAK